MIVQHRRFRPAQLERFKAGQRASYGVLEAVAAALGPASPRARRHCASPARSRCLGPRRSIDAGMDRAAAAYERRDRENIEKAYRDEAAGIAY